MYVSIHFLRCFFIECNKNNYFILDAKITTNDGNSDSVRGKVYAMHIFNYVMKSISDLWLVGEYTRIATVFSKRKT